MNSIWTMFLPFRIDILVHIEKLETFLIDYTFVKLLYIFPLVAILLVKSCTYCIYYNLTFVFFPPVLLKCLIPQLLHRDPRNNFHFYIVSRCHQSKPILQFLTGPRLHSPHYLNNEKVCHQKLRKWSFQKLQRVVEQNHLL